MLAQVRDKDFNWRSFEFITDVDWMKKAKIRGIVIGHRIMFADPPNEIPERTFRHELQHAYQIIREGTARFYFKFFLYSVRYCYYDNPYEIEARRYEDEPLNTHEEKLLWTLRKDCAMSQSA